MIKKSLDFNKENHEGELSRFSSVDRELGLLALRTLETANLNYGGDALAVYMGLGETERLEAAVEAWKENADLKHLLIASAKQSNGAVIDEQNILNYIDESGGRLDGVRIFEDPAHTKEQAEWLREQVMDEGIHAVKLIVSAYHAPRAYATTVSSLSRRPETATTPMVVGLPTYPEGYFSAEHVYDGIAQTGENIAFEEAKKIRRYQPGGDVASDKSWSEHLDKSQDKFDE